MRFTTRVIHYAEEPDYGRSGDVIHPIHLSTTFARTDPEEPTGGFEYTRTSNPTRLMFESKIAAAENGKYGLAFSSGLAAETTILASLLEKGSKVIAHEDLYGGTSRLFEKVFTKFGITYEKINLKDPRNLESIKGLYQMVWLETPSNPLLGVIDIKEISRIAHEEGALVVVDNTFATPALQNPLNFGADIVLHSTTKYINGHSDSLGGALVLNDDTLFEKLKFHQNAIGSVLSPFDSYLSARGLKTLELRMNVHSSNAMEISKFLKDHEKVEKVYYPGLEEHEGHRIARMQMKEFGGMLSFRYKGETKSFLKRLKYFYLAESLGGIESLIEVPYYMTHSSLPMEERIKLGIDDKLIRVSVGIENIEDLLEDFQNSL